MRTFNAFQNCFHDYLRQERNRSCRLFMTLILVAVSVSTLFGGTGSEKFETNVYNIEFGYSKQTAFKLKGERTLVTVLEGFINEYAVPKTAYANYKIDLISRNGQTIYDAKNSNFKLTVTEVSIESGLAYIDVSEIKGIFNNDDGFLIGKDSISASCATWLCGRSPRTGTTLFGSINVVSYRTELRNACDKWASAQIHRIPNPSLQVLILDNNIMYCEPGSPVICETKAGQRYVCGVVQKGFSGNSAFIYAVSIFRAKREKVLPPTSKDAIMTEYRLTHQNYTVENPAQPPPELGVIQSTRPRDFSEVQNYGDAKVVRKTDKEFEKCLDSNNSIIAALYEPHANDASLKQNYPHTSCFLSLVKAIVKFDGNPDSVIVARTNLKRVVDSLEPTRKEIRSWGGSDRFYKNMHYLIDLSSFLISPSPIYMKDSAHTYLLRGDNLSAQHNDSLALENYLIELACHPENSDTISQKIDEIRKHKRGEVVYKKAVYNTLIPVADSTAKLYERSYAYLNAFYGLNYQINLVQGTPEDSGSLNIVDTISFKLLIDDRSRSLDTLQASRTINNMEPGKYLSTYGDQTLLFFSLVTKSLYFNSLPIIADSLILQYTGRTDGMGWRGAVDIASEDFHHPPNLDTVIRLSPQNSSFISSSKFSLRLGRLCSITSSDREKNLGLAYLRAYYAHDRLSQLCPALPVKTVQMSMVPVEEKGPEHRGVDIVIKIPVYRQ